ncbi:MAG: transposase [Rhodospirillales bacterium]|nr:transposase [Acetobacter sp.]
MDLERAFSKPKLLRALTSLEVGEFERLLGRFAAQHGLARQRRTWDGQKRQRSPGAGNLGALPTSRAKLLFILFYFKCYPLQEVMAFLFGMSQPQVSVWVGQLTPLINAALGRELHRPARRPADLERLLAEVPELRLLIIDSTERPVRRSKDHDQQRQDYSGKKKAHRKKNLLVTAERRVVYLGPTVGGSRHDKTLAAESRLRFPADALLLKDSGLQDYEPAGVRTLQPKKKPKSRELRAYEKAINRVVCRARIVVEHAMAGIKRCRIVTDTFRNWRKDLVDEVMLAACGLHNLRESYRAVPEACLQTVTSLHPLHPIKFDDIIRTY